MPPSFWTDPLMYQGGSDSFVGCNDEIEMADEAWGIDFEGEIGVVVGATLRHATDAEARRAIRGLVAANDVSARDWQKNDGQWARAKGCDTFLPLGPEAPAPADLDGVTVVTRHNGVERQRAKASDMVFPIPMLLAYVSRYITLEAGDLLLTGTPAGVHPIAPGDTVEIELVCLSKVSSPVRAGR